MWLMMAWLAACTPDETGYGDTDDTPSFAADSAETDSVRETDNDNAETDGVPETDGVGTDTDTDTDAAEDTACDDTDSTDDTDPPCDSGGGCGLDPETLRAHLTCNDGATSHPWHTAWGELTCVVPGGAVYEVVWFGTSAEGFRAYFDAATGERAALEAYAASPTFCDGSRRHRWWGVNLRGCVAGGTVDVCGVP